MIKKMIRKPSERSRAKWRRRIGQLESLESRTLLACDPIGQTPSVVINEIHSNPNDATELVEFVEMFNPSADAVDIGNWFFSDGVEYVVPSELTIQAGGYHVATENADQFQAKFKRDADGEWVGSLRNDGERIELRSSDGCLVDSVDYKLGFPWPTVGDAPGFSMQLVQASIDNDLGGAWRSAIPTPGAANATLIDNPPPSIRQVVHQPHAPKSGDAVTVTAKVTDPDLVGNVKLEYQLVDPGEYIRLTDNAYDTDWTSMAMVDNGEVGDPVADDDIYTLVLPKELQVHRRLVRYRIIAEDTLGASIQVPYEDDPQPNFAYFVYDGILEWTGSLQPGQEPDVTYSQEVMNRLQTYHLVADETDVNNSQYDRNFRLQQFRGTLIYDGIVYDHIEFRNRGKASIYQVGKNKWKLNFLRGHALQARDNFGNRYNEDWDKINIVPGSNPWWRDNASTSGTILFEPIAFRLYELAGTPSPKTHFFQFRVIDSEVEAATNNQYEGDFWGLYIGIEQPAGNFLDERGLPDGSTYNVHRNAENSVKRHQGSLLPSGNQDLDAFIVGTNQTQTFEWYQQNLNLASYFAWNSINLAVNGSDLRPHENVNYYHNQENDQWYIIPWDLDLTFEDRPHFDRPDEEWETIQQLLKVDELKIAYDNRVREILDLLFDNGDAENLVDEYVHFLTDGESENTIVDANQAEWDYHPRKRKMGRWYANFTPELLPERNWESYVQYVKDFITDGGYGHDRLAAKLDESVMPEKPVLTYTGAADFALNQISVQTSDYVDPQGDPFGGMQWRVAEVHNPTVANYNPLQPNIYEIEGTTWESGRIEVFNSEMSIPISSVLPDHTYRIRVRLADNVGNWSHWSAPIEILPTPGVSELTDALRITEVHYHPADPSDLELTAGHTNSDDFEFIEIVNISDKTVSLVGAALMKVDIDGILEGVDFRFEDGTITELAPGSAVVVVEDLEAFRLRYGDSIPTAGQWDGQLSNAGETITLSAFGNPFLQFAYDDLWYPNTDGAGLALEIIDASGAELDGWRLRDNWKESSNMGGSPGTWQDFDIAGDSNRDGIFNSSDLILIFSAGEYEDDIPANSTWEEGDWNGDGDFTTSDLIFAFEAGTYVAAAMNPKRDLANLFWRSSTSRWL